MTLCGYPVNQVLLGGILKVAAEAATFPSSAVLWPCVVDYPRSYQAICTDLFSCNILVVDCGHEPLTVAISFEGICIACFPFNNCAASM